MVYALVITIAAAVLIFAVLSGAVMLARRAAGAGGVRLPSLGRWRWYPSPLGLLLLLPMLGLLLFRVVPGLFLLPLLLRFISRGRRLGNPPFFRPPRRNRPDDDDAIPGEYRPLDDE